MGVVVERATRVREGLAALRKVVVSMRDMVDRGEDAVDSDEQEISVAFPIGTDRRVTATQYSI